MKLSEQLDLAVNALIQIAAPTNPDEESRGVAGRALDAIRPAPKTATPKPERAPRTPSSGKKKTHVVRDYTITSTNAEMSGQDIEMAFAGGPNVVHPPLLKYEMGDINVAFVTVQYEPPNAGGTVSDVDRIVGRAIRKLAAAGIQATAERQ